MPVKPFFSPHPRFEYAEKSQTKMLKSAPYDYFSALKPIS